MRLVPACLGEIGVAVETTGVPTKAGSLFLHAHSSTFSANIVAAEEAFGNIADSEEIRSVVIDMSDIYRLDSRGLRILVDLKKGLEDRGGELVLSNVSMAVKRLLAYVKLDEYFKMID